MSKADLEISLYRRDALGLSNSVSDSASYGVELRFSRPDSETDQRKAGVNPVRFDPAELRTRALDAVAYGQYLAAQLLAEPEVRSFFDQALAVAQAAADVPLRLRLNMAPGAPELHNLRWETLWLPGSARTPAHRREPALLALSFQPGLEARSPAARVFPARPGGGSRPVRRRQIQPGPGERGERAGGRAKRAG